MPITTKKRKVRLFATTVYMWLQHLFAKLPLGQRGERLAARHFQKLGYRVVERSLRSQLGEVDLIVAQGREVVFVEVKTRATGDFGGPELAVDRDKRRRITRLAVQFLKSRKIADVAVRFDIVAITWPEERGAKPNLKHFPAAFEAEGPWSI